MGVNNFFNKSIVVEANSTIFYNITQHSANYKLSLLPRYYPIKSEYKFDMHKKTTSQTFWLILALHVQQTDTNCYIDLHMQW